MKFKILKTFRDKHTKEVYEAEENTEVDFTAKRAKEIEKNLGKGFIEKIEPKE